MYRYAGMILLAEKPKGGIDLNEMKSLLDWFLMIFEDYLPMEETMRPIRFRLWYTKHETFVNEPYYAISLLGSIQIEGHTSVEPKRYIIQQFTGLKDHKGQEIYEGDIVRVEFPEYTGKEPDTGWLTWDTTEGSWRIQSYAWWCYPYQGDLTIIGNIYETPLTTPAE